jgi:glutamate dehydrogenase
VRPDLPGRLRAAAGCDTTALVIAFAAARQILGVDALWDQVSALDGKASAAGQLALYKALAYALRSLTFWLARRAFKDKSTVKALVEAYGPSVKALSPWGRRSCRRSSRRPRPSGPRPMSPTARPRPWPRRWRRLQPVTTAADPGRPGQRAPAGRSRTSPGSITRWARRFGFDRLRSAAGSFVGGDAFERLAVRRLIEDMLSEQTAITQAVLKFAANAQAGDDEGSAKAAVTARGAPCAPTPSAPPSARSRTSSRPAAAGPSPS